MAGLLLDTNVVSEFRRLRKANHKVLNWLASVEDRDLFLSVMTLGEIRKGVEQLRNRDLRQSEVLDVWLTTLGFQFNDRILPVTPAIADYWGRLEALASFTDRRRNSWSDFVGA